MIDYSLKGGVFFFLGGGGGMYCYRYPLYSIAPCATFVRTE